MSLTLAEINKKFPVGTKIHVKGAPSRRGVVKLASEVTDSSHIGCMGDRIGSAAEYLYGSSKTSIACVAVESEGMVSLKVADMVVVVPSEKLYTQAELDTAVKNAIDNVKNQVQQMVWNAEDTLSDHFQDLWSS